MMAVWSNVLLGQCEQALRLDAEYYQPEYLRYAVVVAKGDLLKRITTITHPTEIKRIYEDSGIQILLAQNVRSNHLNFSINAFMPSSAKEQLLRNRLKYGDVVMTRSGANFGEAAVYKGEPKEIYACADVLIIRPNGVPGGYLATYFNTRVGRALLTRGAYGMAQPHIAPSYLYTMYLPRLGDALEQEIDELVTEAYAKEKISQTLYAEAESLLKHTLGLDKLDLSHQIAQVMMFSDVISSDRLDSEYWGTEYTTLMDYLKKTSHKTLAELSDFSNGATPRGANYLVAGIPFLRIQNVSKNRLNLDDLVYIDAETHNNLLRRSQLHPGDVLITITGRIGTATVVPEDITIGNINQHIVRLRLSDKQINPYYLSVFLNSRAGRLQTEREAYGTTREALPYYCLGRIIVPMASDILQKRVEAKVREAERFLKDAEHFLNEAKHRVEEIILGKES
jgi:type I restriction enzyme, S subunit